jgi:hypothetical protein
VLPAALFGLGELEDAAVCAGEVPKWAAICSLVNVAG